MKTLYDEVYPHLSVKPKKEKFENLPIKGVRIGDRFKTGKNTTAIVLDIWEMRSVATNNIEGHVCIAQAEGSATNKFNVPFSTVVRNKIK